MMKKITAVILAMAMMVGMGTTVFADEGTPAEISVETLWQKAILQNQQLLRSRSNDEILELSVTELIEQREDVQGNVEKDYSKTTLSLIDDNGEKINLRTVNPGNGSHGSSVTEYGTTVATTVFYTARIPDMFYWAQFKVNRVLTTIQRSGNDIYPLSGDILLTFPDVSNYDYTTFTCQSAPFSQSFTLYSTDFNYHEAPGSSSQILAQSTVELSNGWTVVQTTPLDSDTNY